MIRKTTILLLLPLFFTACVERGHSLLPASIHTPSQKMKMKKSNKIIGRESKTVNKLITIKKVPTHSKAVTVPVKTQIKPIEIQKKPVATKKTHKEKVSFFYLSDKMKNNISGIFVFVIGLIIFV